jgi:hypothetical protein
MKVRWSDRSLRVRITPSELEALSRDEPVRANLRLPGGLIWQIALLPHKNVTELTSEGGEVRFQLADADRERLERPDAEGIYFRSDGDPALRYFIEKDFPCAHPRLVDALEAATETFAATPSFEARKAAGGVP